MAKTKAQLAISDELKAGFNKTLIRQPKKKTNDGFCSIVRKKPSTKKKVNK